MGLRFRKSIRIGKAFRINLSKGGVGFSVGIPGTGISYGVSPGRRRQSKEPGLIAGCLSKAIAVVLLSFLALFGLALVASFFAPRPRESGPSSPPIVAPTAVVSSATPDRPAPQPTPDVNPSDPPRPNPGPPASGPVEAGPEPEVNDGPAPADDPRALSILQMGRNHERDGRNKAAIRCYSEVCNGWPGSVEAEQAIARIKGLKGQLDPAAMPSGISPPPKDLAQRPPRNRRAQDFSAVDAAFQSMGAAASGGGGSSLCGAPTRSGAPCRNPVAGGGYCYLHR